MLNRMTLKAVTAAVVVLTAGAAARADFVDNFVIPDPPVGQTLTTADPTFTRTGDVISAGLTRTVVATLLQQGVTSTDVVLGTVSGVGQLSLGTGVNARGYATATYQYSTATDLSGTGTDFVFVFTQADLNVPFSVTLVTGPDLGPSISQTQSGVATAGTGTYTIQLSGFNTVDLTQVQSITLSLNRDAAVGDDSVLAARDFSLSSIALTTPQLTPIPAPPAAVLGLVALPVLGLYRRSRKVAAAV